MQELRKDGLSTENNIHSKEEQRPSLRSSKIGTRCSSLDFTNNSEDMLLDRLAEILVEAFLEQEEYESNKTSSDILPGVNKGTS
jgi:hypothetical protein